MSKHWLIISPHFDDAVLSCAEHISQWRKQKDKVTVITVFSRFWPKGTDPKKYVKILPSYTKDYLTLSGEENLEKFASLRHEEDVASLYALAVQRLEFGFVDGGFRSVRDHELKKNIFLYQTEKKLFAGSVHSSDKIILNEITELILSFIHNKKPSDIVGPLGIGGHADHLICQKAITKIIKEAKSKHICVWNFRDQPYYFHQKINLVRKIIYEFNIFFIKFKLISSSKFFRQYSDLKRRAVSCYASQINLLFPKGLDTFMIENQEKMIPYAKK